MERFGRRPIKLLVRHRTSWVTDKQGGKLLVSHNFLFSEQLLIHVTPLRHLEREGRGWGRSLSWYLLCVWSQTIYSINLWNCDSKENRAFEMVMNHLIGGESGTKIYIISSMRGTGDMCCQTKLIFSTTSFSCFFFATCRNTKTTWTPLPL